MEMRGFAVDAAVDPAVAEKWNVLICSCLIHAISTRTGEMKSQQPQPPQKRERKGEPK
jgi:hypothetical protein